MRAAAAAFEQEAREQAPVEKTNKKAVNIST
jgi:hypothetical protein